MSSILAWFGGDPNALLNYLFGLVIIVLYAKDKFNTPTYDKESMGPFSQLPPQLLTIDAQYRQGLRIYIFLLAALYTALCIIGPSTFNNQSVQFGVTANTNQLWPVASATFLISTGAAKDSSVLGKIEHFIRQYAHKAAYIPSIVSNLAYAIRNVETTPWLKENKDKLKQDDFNERKSALTTLIGEKFVALINDNPRQQGHLAAWARANIVFYCMQQIFRGALPSERLSQIKDLPENISIFERLKKERADLGRRFISAEEQQARKSGPDVEVNLDQLLIDIQRFSKEVSLTIVVMLSQAVRTFSDLNDRLAQLGFREIELRDHSDHLVYLVMVNLSIAAGAFVSYALLTALGWAKGFFAQAVPSNEFDMVSYVSELLIVVTGALIYMIVFKVIDYLREGYLDISEWRENLEGYVMAVVMASVCSAIVCILLMVLLLSPLNLLSYIWMDPAGLVQQFMFQLIIAGLAAGFAVSYLRQAVKVRWGDSLSRMVRDELFSFREFADGIKLVHAVLAALLVGVLTEASIAHTKRTMIDAAKSSLEPALQSLDQNQGWLGQKLPAAKAPGVSSPDSASDFRLPAADLVSINCKLLDVDAAMHAFDLENRYFQYVGDFTDAVRKGMPDSELGAAKKPDCSKLTTKTATIKEQLDQVKDICLTLSKVGFFKASPAGPSNSGPPAGASQPQPPSQRVIVPTLFRAPERCELNSVATQDPNEQSFLSLGNSLFGLFSKLDSLEKFSRGESSRSVVVFPMVTALFLAYAFGAGCRVWRAWWLNNEAGRQEIDRLKEQIASVYRQQFNSGEFEQWLISPLSVLNNVAPKEAVRYEGLKIRLYAKIENKQIDFGSAAAPTERSQGTPAGEGEAAAKGDFQDHKTNKMGRAATASHRRGSPEEQEAEAVMASEIGETAGKYRARGNAS